MEIIALIAMFVVLSVFSNNAEDREREEKIREHKVMAYQYMFHL